MKVKKFKTYWFDKSRRMIHTFFGSTLVKVVKVLCQVSSFWDIYHGSLVWGPFKRSVMNSFNVSS